jgi:hypothetical protein
VFSTPGPINLSFLAAYIPKRQLQYTSYITRTATAATGGATATQAAADSGGASQTVALGEYVYTFHTKAPSGFDPTATHRIGIYGSRNLTVWNLGTNYADTTFDFVPAGGAPAPPRHRPYGGLQLLSRPAQRHDHQHGFRGPCGAWRIPPRRASASSATSLRRKIPIPEIPWT